MITKEAIVLAGGLGTRLQDVLPDIPKCMAPVKGKPFLSYILDYLIRQDISKVILSVGYRKEFIIRYFGNNYNSLLIDYAIEDVPLGTGGAAKLAFDYCNQDQAFVMNGDTCFLPDLFEMEKLHIQSKADITIAVKNMPETSRYGLVLTDRDDRIVDFREKDSSSGSGLINGGLYLVKKLILDVVQEKKFSLENDVFNVSCSGLWIQAFRTDAYFLDIGIPGDYAKAQTMINFPGDL